MPIYEYRCKECEKTVELLQTMKGRAPGKCPSCGKTRCMSRQVSAGTSAHFKGKGFYCTDYPKKKS